MIMPNGPLKQFAIDSYEYMILIFLIHKSILV